MERITKAYLLAEEAHRLLTRDGKPQLRKGTGVPYIVHPIRVALVASAYAYERQLQDVDNDEFVAAAFLHDVLEDTTCPPERIRDECGATVLRLVLELTNPSIGSKAPRAERKRQDREHIRVASRPAKALKLLDRADNLSEIDTHEPQFIRLYCKESRQLVEATGDIDGLGQNVIWRCEVLEERYSEAFNQR